jgi:hypothetical protein
MAESVSLSWGCNRALEAQAGAVTVAWGARAIAPYDLLPSRMACAGGEDGSPERQKLLAWLNDGAGAAAQKRALELNLGLGSDEWYGAGSQALVSLYRDEQGEVMASPQGSHGYVYIAAWLFEHVER